MVHITSCYLFIYLFVYLSIYLLWHLPWVKKDTSFCIMEAFCLLTVKDCNYHSLGCLSQFQSRLFQPSSYPDQIFLETPDVSQCTGCMFKLFYLTIWVVCYRRLYSRSHSIQWRIRLSRNWESVEVAQAELALQPKNSPRHTMPMWWSRVTTTTDGAQAMG